MTKSAGSFKINGEIDAPPSKSYTHRAILASSLSEGKTIIKKPSFADDIYSFINAVRNTGSKIKVNNKDSEIIISSGTLELKSNIINCGESGFTLRVMSVLTSLFPEEVMLTGKNTLMNRNFNEITSELTKTGIDVITNKNKAPIKLRGKINPGEYQIDASGTSQLLSGLLFTMPLLDGDSRLQVNGLTSSPFIDMTLSILKQAGIKISRKDDEFFIPGNQKYELSNITIEGDWGLSSFFIAGAAKNGNLRINNLNPESYQGERIFIDIAKEAGVHTSFDGNSLVVTGSEDIRCFEFDATDYPDLIPPLVVLALNCKGKTRIKGIHRLYNKESNRAVTLKDSFAKLGAVITLENDDMIIEGGKLRGGEAPSYYDHRIAMALAVSAANSENDIIIKNAEAVMKSYKAFYKDLETIIK